MSDAIDNSAEELSARLRDEEESCHALGCRCSRRTRSPPNKRRRHRETLSSGGMAHLIAFDHLVPFEMDLNSDENDEKRQRVFAAFYHFGSKLHECLRKVALEYEDKDLIPIPEVLQLLKYEHYLESRFPPISALLDVIERREFDDAQVLFKIADFIEAHKADRPEDFMPYTEDPDECSIDLAAETVTCIGNMAYHFLAATFAEDIMKGVIPEPPAEGPTEPETEDDDEVLLDGEMRTVKKDGMQIEFQVTTQVRQAPRDPIIYNYRFMPQAEALEIQQNTMLLLATRLGIEQFLLFSKECGKLEFQGNNLNKITPLMEAAAAGSDVIAERLLEWGADPNVQSIPNCNTAFIYAASQNCENVVKMMLEYKGEHELDVYSINNCYRDAITEAAVGGAVHSLKAILDAGFGPRFDETEQDEGKRIETALTFGAMRGDLDVVSTILDYQDEHMGETEEDRRRMVYERYSALLEAAMEGNIEVCQLMLSRGALTHIGDGIKFDTESPMMLACMNGFPQLIEILCASGAQTDEINSKGYTCLMEACNGLSENQTDVVRELLSRRCDVNAINEKTGDTALSLAARRGYIGIMKLLVDRGADLIAGTTSPIVEAARSKRTECVQFILAYCKNVPQEQLSRALVAAAEAGCLPIVEEVVRAGADLNFEQDERTGMMKAAENDHYEIVQYLVQKGASVNYKSTKNDATALSMACTEGNMDVAQFLIRNGADPMLKMDDGYNCFMKAAQHGSFDLMNLLVEFTKGNMAMDMEPPKLGIHRCKTNKKKRKRSTGMMDSDLVMMVNGIMPRKKNSKLADFPYSKNEVDMFSHLLRCQEQMAAYEEEQATLPPLTATAIADIEKQKDSKEDPKQKEKANHIIFIHQALAGLQSAYGFTPDGRINFPPHPNRSDRERLYNGELVPNIKLWAEQVAYGWMEMERKVGKTVEMASFQISNNGDSNAAAAISAAAAAANGIDSNAYLLSVFNRMNNGEEMPRVPATVGSLNAASAAMSGISFHSDDAMRLFGGASFANKMIADNKKVCNHQQFASVYHLQEGVFREALLRLSSMYAERRGAAVSVQNMNSNFPIDCYMTRPPTKAAQVGPKMTSLTTPKKPETPKKKPEENKNVMKFGDKANMDPAKVYPGILKLARDMERLYHQNSSDVSRDIAVTTAYIASTLPDQHAEGLNVESGERILKRLLATMSEKQKNAVLARAKSTINNEPGTEVLARGVDALSDTRLKEEYIKLFRETADSAFFEQRNSGQSVKSVEQKKGKSLQAANVGSQISSAISKVQMGKTGSSQQQPQQPQQQQQQGQLRRTHSEGDGAERAKARSNAIDKATESTLETPLTMACLSGHREIVELLLKEGANIEHRDKKGFSPLIIAATSGHASVVEVLLKNHAAIEAQSDRTKDTALSLACSGGRKDVVELLLAHGANKEHRNVSDYTPLSLASSGGYIEIVNLLLQAGSEINSRTGSKLGISPLMLAAMNGHREVTKILLEKGSDINAQIETNRNTALTLASFQGRTEVVRLLLEYNANVEHRAKTGLTPLMECASGGYVDVGNLLIDNGADPNASPVQSTKDTALTIAAEKGHEKYVEMLLENDAAVDVRNKKGCSALWLACNGGHLGTAQALVAKGADTDTFDNRKMSPMVAAFRKGHTEIIKFLVGHAKQFPNENDLVRIQAASECPDVAARCGECIIVIRNAKKAQAESAEESANNLLQIIEDEKEKLVEKKQKAKDKRKQKKENKKKNQEQQAGPVPPEESESIVEPEPEAEPAREPEPEPEPEPVSEPAPVPVEEPPKRRNRRKTNPDGVPKGPKAPAKTVPPAPAVEEEEEPAEILKPIKVNIPSPAPIVAQTVSPGSYSESEDWQKAGKEGKKVRTKKTERGTAPNSTGSSHHKNPSASSSYSDRQHPWEVDTKGVKAYEFTVPGKIVSRVIGKSGSNINAVREAAGAQIEIDKLGGSKEDDRHITVRGSAEIVSNAVNIIHYLIYDKDVLIQDAIRTVLRGNESIASSLSSEGTSKSAAESNPSLPHSISSASIARQSSSPAPVSIPPQTQQQLRSSKGHGQQATKEGGNVWQQRMAARGDTVPTQKQTSQAKHVPPSRQQSVPAKAAAPQVVAKPTKAPMPAPAPVPVQQPIDRVIAPPTKREPIAAAIVKPVQPVNHQPAPTPQKSRQPEVVQQSRVPEPIGQQTRFPEPISRPAQTVQQPSAFSKAPGSRVGAEFSRAPGPSPQVQQQAPLAIAQNRKDLFDERLQFTQFKPTTSTASSVPSTSAAPTPSNGGANDGFDISKLRMFEDSTTESIWSKNGDDGDTWGSLFTQFLAPNNSGTKSPLNTTGSSAAAKSNASNEWGSSDFMSQMFPGTSNQGTPATSQPAASSQLAALETKGWMPSNTTATPSTRDPVQRQVPLFARSPSSLSSNTPSLQQQQMQQQQRMMQEHQHSQQVLQQQQTRLQYHSQQQQFPSQQHQSHQQLFNQIQAMSLGQSTNNPYDMLAQQLSLHRQEHSSSAPGPSQPSGSQLSNSYYPSPSYTDASVLGQLNMQTLSQRGIKQFDGFNSDQGSSSDSVIANLFNEQQQQKKSQAASYMQQQQTAQPFGATASRMGMMQPVPPPFVVPGAPPGFGDLGRTSASGATRQMYQQYGQQQQQQPQPFNQMTQADWDQRMLLQRQAGQQQPQSQQPQKWSNTWNQRM